MTTLYILLAVLAPLALILPVLVALAVFYMLCMVGAILFIAATFPFGYVKQRRILRAYAERQRRAVL